MTLGRPQGSISRGLVLLRSSNGSRVLDRPRDMPGYDGRGASTALLLAGDRLKDQRGKRALVLAQMALEQVEREQQGCKTHFPVGANGEFVWDGTTEKVGT